MPRAVAAVLVALLVGATTSACGDGSGETGDKGYVSGEGVITRLAADERRRPGPISGRTLDGEDWRLADHRGRVVVMNVWASWCPPCRAEAPDLVAAAEAMPGVEFVGVDVRESSEANGLAFEEQYAVPYPSLYDPAGRTLLAFAGTLPPNAIPSTVVIDAEGRVAASVLGRVPSKRTLQGLVADVREESR